jgi:DNA-binding XRE family transcriptional regulator
VVPRRPGPYVFLKVADDGPGIPPDRRCELFEIHTLGEGELRRLGMGLWLCRRILRAHGGEIWLDDAEGGTSISSVWPRWPQPAVKEQSSQPQSRWPTDRIAFGKAVRFAREKAGLTRLDLSARASIADSTIRNIETGRHKPTHPIRVRLIRALEEVAESLDPAAELGLPLP